VSGDDERGTVATARSVVIVDDDEWVRRGRVHALEQHPAFASVVGIDPTEALAWTTRWADVDSVVVDAHDSRADWDKFVGVAVVRHVRVYRSPAETVVVMITGHAQNDRLRLRAAEAGADWFFAHADVRTADDLVTAILDPGGIRLERSADGAALDEALDLVDHDGARALFDGSASQKQVSLSRRRIITLRSRLSRTLGLTSTAPLKSIAEVLNDARGADDGDRPRPT